MVEDDNARKTFWRTAAIELGMHSERIGDHIRARLDNLAPNTTALHIHPYRGHGADRRFTISGRVLRNAPTTASVEDTLWANLKRSYLLFETDELAGAQVLLEMPTVSLTVQTDEEGYFRFDNILLPDNLTEAECFTCQLSLPAFPELSEQVTGTIQWLEAEAQFGVISDIDDTIMHTEATSLLKMMRTTLLESPASRLAFAGISALYNSLHKKQNPVFYVSSSPWNLYTFLEEFMTLNNIVPGPLFLRDFGIDKHKFIAGPHEQHKRTAIETILNSTGTLRFILIGDSGQHDPEIYTQIAKNHPERIMAIYIRDVSNDLRDTAVQTLREELGSLGIDLVLASDSVVMAEHAHAHAFINDDALHAVKAGHS